MTRFSPVVAAALLVTTAAAQKAAVSDKTEDPAPDGGGRYTTREKHDPSGIGKFYLGREIARVMGHQGIAWLERDNRQEEENLSRLIELLDPQPGDTVADIGAGSGVITFLISRRVGDDGTVYAVDIQPEMLDALRTKAEKRGVTNVTPVQGTATDPKLPAGRCDLAVMVDVYHEFDFPYEMLSAIVDGLKVGGRVAFVEYRKEDPSVPIREVHKMSEAQVRKEATQDGLRLKFVETLDDLPRQHVIIFERTE